MSDRPSGKSRQTIRRSASRRGRPPKPAQLHKIEGTFQPVRHGAAATDLEAPGQLAERAPPRWMTRAQKKLWKEVLLDAPHEILRRIDWALFANYIELVDRHARAVLAQRQLDQSVLPFLVRGKNGLEASPYLRVINQCVMLMTRLQTEMGFTPVARARFRNGQTELDEDDAGWARLGRLRVVDGGKK
jgi:P27 family predicted phage terminase small subunit